MTPQALTGSVVCVRHVANGEILVVSLLMEDVLLSGEQDQAIYMANSDDEDDTTTSVTSAAASSHAGKPSTEGAAVVAVTAIEEKKGTLSHH